MGQALPNQHPAVVLRSRYSQLRALLAVAMIAVVGLTVAVVVLAIHDNGGATSGSATELTVSNPAAATRSDGGPEETAVAATVDTQSTVSGPDESSIADAIGTAEAPTGTGGPDESAVAGAVSGR